MTWEHKAGTISSADHMAVEIAVLLCKCDKACQNSADSAHEVDPLSRCVASQDGRNSMVHRAIWRSIGVEVAAAAMVSAQPGPRGRSWMACCIYVALPGSIVVAVKLPELTGSLLLSSCWHLP